MLGYFDRHVVIVARSNKLTQCMKKVKQSSVYKRNVYFELVNHPQKDSCYISIDCLNSKLWVSPYTFCTITPYTLNNGKPLRKPPYITICISNAYMEVWWIFFDLQVKMLDMEPSNTSTQVEISTISEDFRLFPWISTKNTTYDDGIPTKRCA